ncbi:Hpt domain-containing protein [Rhizobium sp. KVB221]|uniref:Hpt domain-containing protein n=1 Tax=Rhizobium setariae TaxID=2801340 RepID=A0A937CQA3_9HYPH|nr:Hpt domain-containing protein [Rhizobium setariae]MBL0372757.1 Hpt domain-containing protein [Rhizobium setariae]
MAALSIAFGAPDHYSGVKPSNHRPIDLVHLARQTSGDKELELEVLRMFARQARTCMNELAHAQQETVCQTAHKLKGAALAVGAFIVSDAAEQVEAHAQDAKCLASLGAAVVEVENFIQGLSR